MSVPAGAALVLVPSILAVLGVTTLEASPAPPSNRTPTFPAGTEIVHFQFREGLIYAPATLISHSGRDTTGDLILDTGAPFLVLREGVFNALRPDTAVKIRYDLYELRRRPLATVQIGPVTLRDVPVEALISDTLLADVLGLFAPSLFGDQGIGLDCEAGTWAIVPPALGFISPDTGTLKEIRLEYAARMRRSHADYGRVLAPEAIGIPFRLFEGGRMLVSVRALDPAANWRGPSLTLLLDTGASCSALFQESAERLTRAHQWPWLRDREVHTAYGVIRSDHTVIPRLIFADAEVMQMDRVEVAVLARSTLDSIRTALPERVDGLLGTNVLARFRILIDSVNRILWLTPVDATDQGSRPFADVGLELEWRWGQMRVAAVRPGSSASQQGVAFGDIVVSIEGIAMSGFEPDSAKGLLEGTEGSEVRVILRREGTERVLRLRREAVTAHDTTNLEPHEIRH